MSATANNNNSEENHLRLIYLSPLNATCMPREQYYADLSLSEILIKFAEYHSKPSTRHITAFEKQTLYDAAKKLMSIGM